MASRKIKGKADQAKGSVRQAVGKVTGKRSTEAKGKAERIKGKIKETLG
ncbi:MAG: CsbD family protein [Dehalococcoidia bacterium]